MGRDQPAAGALNASVPEQASFYRAALLLGLVRGELAVSWADRVLGGAADAPAAFVDLSTTDPSDLTSVRHALLALCEGERPSRPVIDALLGVIARDLAHGRRDFADTMRVLSQLRKFLAIDAELNERIKGIAVEYTLRTPDKAASVERQIREWLDRHIGTEKAFLASES